MISRASVCLNDVLKAREDRAAWQQTMIRRYQCPLISFTVNMPGPVKLNETSLRIHREGVRVIRLTVGHAGSICRAEQVLEKPTGVEAYFAVDGDPTALKRLTCAIEETHLLGRLFDLDVLDSACRPVSRTELGLPRRKCLICDQDAVICIRAGSHSLPELLARINDLVGELGLEVPDHGF